MNITYTSRSGNITDEMKEYLEKKFKKFKFYYEQIINIQVIFSNEKGRYNVELKVSANHDTFFAEASAPTWRESFDEVIDKVEREIKKKKDKITDHHL
jgi:putative sigma-54 modulation protein